MRKDELSKIGGFISLEPTITQVIWKKPLHGQLEKLLKKFTEIKDTQGKREAFDSDAGKWVDIQTAISETSEAETADNSKAGKKKLLHLLNYEEHFEFTIGVVRPAFDEVERIITIEESRNRTAQLIALCLRLQGESGNYDQLISYEEACRLEFNLAHAIAKAISSANNLELDRKK